MESYGWKDILDGNIPFMQQNLLLTEIFYGYLIKTKIFTDEIIQEIRDGLESNEARILKLVTYLKRRDFVCFQKFLSILSKTHNQHVKDRLETLYSNGNQPNDAEAIGTKDVHDILRQKDIRIRDLELLVADLQDKLNDSGKAVKSEMQRSQHYLEVIHRLSQMGPMSREATMLEEREADVDELVDEIDNLKDQIEALESELKHATQDLEKAKHQLNKALESERNIKRSLGLRENADQHEINIKIAEIQSNSRELQRYREEMDSITEMKDVYNEKIRKLTQEMKKLESEKRRKDIEIERLRRNKDDNLVLQNAKALLSWKKPEELVLPRINIGSDTRRDERLKSAREPKKKVIEQSNILTKTDPKYCVICRKEYYVRDGCRFHTASLKDGKYACCGSLGYGTTVSHGCKAIASHLYVDSTSGEVIFYDQRGRQLNIKEIDVKESKLFTGR